MDFHHSSRIASVVPKKGDGALWLYCSNSYTGGTYIHGGIVTVEADSLGSGTVHLYGGGLEIREGYIANDVIVEGNASLRGKIGDGKLTLCENSKLTVNNYLLGHGGDAVIKDGATLDLAACYIQGYAGGESFGVIQVGSSSIGNGKISQCQVNVAEGKTLTLLANTSATSGTVFNLGEGATLNLGGNSVNFADTTVSSSGDGGYLGHGTIEGDLTVTSGSRINLLDNTTVTGGVNLGDNATLDLGKNTITGAAFTLSGSATIGNGTIEGGLTVAGSKSLALLADTTITGGVSLGAQSSFNLGGNTFHIGGEGGSQVTFSGDATVSDGTLVLDSDWSPGYALTFTGITLDLNKHTLSKPVTLVGDNAIGNGTLNTNLNVGAGDTLTLCGTLNGNQDNKDKITLGNNATLDLGGQYLDRFCYVTMKGDAFIGNGLFDSQIVVETDHKLTLSANLRSGGSIVLRNNATLDLNNHSYAGTIYGPDYDDSGTISATIGNGTLDSNLTVGRENTLNLCGDLGGSGAITLKDSATLNLGTHTLSKDVSLTGSATIGGGSFDGNLAVNSEKTLTLSGNLGGSGTISLGDKAKLDLGGHALANNVSVDGSNTTITGGGNIKGDITVQTGKSLKLDGDLDGLGHVTLGANSTLDLGSQDRDCFVTVIGNNAAILNGGLMLYMTITENVNFTLSQDSAEISCTIYLEGNNTLDLGGKTVYDIQLNGYSATIGNGTVDKDIFMGGGRLLTLSGDISFNNGGIVIAGSNNTVNLNGRTITGSVTTDGVNSNNKIGNGTIAGNVIVNRGSRIHLYGETHFKGGTMTFENDPTTIKAVDAEKGGLLKDLTVSEGLIAGTDRQSSLADGLEISRTGYDLTLENLVLTANNKISVGDGHSITLNNVTIKMSDDIAKLEDGIFYFDLNSLINCDLGKR